MPVEIIDETDTPELAAVAEHAAVVLLEAIGREGAELSVLLVDDHAIRELNRDWRGKDKATDVLSFSLVEEGGEEDGTVEEGAAEELDAESELEEMSILFEEVGDAATNGGFDLFALSEDEHDDGDPAVMLGDVVVSVETLRRQAHEGGWTDEEELVRLLLHGLLHLLGHDHEEAEQAAVMHAEEARLVAVLAEHGIACAWEQQAS
jgi:probable rRNA maturation factor